MDHMLRNTRPFPRPAAAPWHRIVWKGVALMRRMAVVNPRDGNVHRRVGYTCCVLAPCGRVLRGSGSECTLTSEDCRLANGIEAKVVHDLRADTGPD